MLNLPAARHYASRSLDPASHDERTIAIGMIAAMPSQAVADVFGPAAVHGYHMGLEDLPADLLLLAVKRALQDDKRKFRPGPGELRAYIAEDLASRRRRQKRLSVFAVVQTPEEQDAAEPFSTASSMNELFAKLDVGHRNLTGAGLPGYRPVTATTTHIGPPRAPSAAEMSDIRSVLTPSPAVSDASDALRKLAGMPPRDAETGQWEREYG